MSNHNSIILFEMLWKSCEILCKTRCQNPTWPHLKYPPTTLKNFNPFCFTVFDKGLPSRLLLAAITMVKNKR